MRGCYSLSGARSRKPLAAYVGASSVGQRRSEIWLVRYRDREELLVVLRANFFVHWPLNTIVTLHHRPRRIESIRIVKRDVHLHRLTAVDQCKALDDVQLLGMWRAEIIDERLVIQPDRIDHQRVALVATDRLAVPGRSHIG